MFLRGIFFIALSFIPHSPFSASAEGSGRAASATPHEANQGGRGSNHSGEQLKSIDVLAYIRSKGGDESWYCGSLSEHREIEVDIDNDQAKDKVVVFAAGGDCSGGLFGTKEAAAFLANGKIVHTHLFASGIDFNSIVASGNGVLMNTIPFPDQEDVGMITISMSNGTLVATESRHDLPAP